MDEGTLVNEDNGRHWKQLWPRKFNPQLSGHNWQLAIGNNNGKDRIISTCSTWDASLPNRVVISEDGGATFKVAKTGLPDYRPMANTMWGMSYPRSLAVDHSNPNVVYLGMDGDATDDKCGGGVFKSVNGGYTWKQLAHQPGSRRCFYGLSVDPTNSKRLYWGAAAGMAGSGGVTTAATPGSTCFRTASGSLTSWWCPTATCTAGRPTCGGAPTRAKRGRN